MVLCLLVYTQWGKTECVIFRLGFDFKDSAVLQKKKKKKGEKVLQWVNLPSLSGFSLNSEHYGNESAGCPHHTYMYTLLHTLYCAFEKYHGWNFTGGCLVQNVPVRNYPASENLYPSAAQGELSDWNGLMQNRCIPHGLFKIAAAITTQDAAVKPSQAKIKGVSELSSLRRILHLDTQGAPPTEIWHNKFDLKIWAPAANLMWTN